MLCISSQQSQDRSPPVALGAASPSMLDEHEGREAAFGYDLKNFCATEAPDEAPHSSDDSATVESTEETTPAGSGYFACFRRPFHRRRSVAKTAAPAVAAQSTDTTAQQLSTPTTNYGELGCKLLLWERELRHQLVRHEQEELTQMVWSVKKMLLPVMEALRYVNTLSVAQEEVVWRWSIRNDYYHFLLGVTQLQEVLHRRSLSFAEEPRDRKEIENVEVPHWIAARRLQVTRETQESAAAKEEERERRLAHFSFIQQQLYQIFLLGEEEQADRMDVERLQRLYAGSILEAMAKVYRHVRLCQLRYEAMGLELQPEVTRDLVADEALHRALLRQDQALGFKKMQADEIRNYLASSRQELLNRRVEEG
nr:unnamed protein product [Leishmania braziliensis]